MSFVRRDRIDRKGGIVHLNNEFREVARLANRAGLEGFEVADVDVGMDLTLELADLKARIEITYRDVKGIGELKDALQRSLSLQSHYAKVLNSYDGGDRLTFTDADEWIKRLRYLAEVYGEIS